MGVTYKARYLGGKKLEVTHDQSGTVITTDAPRDNQGDGSSFSPTDLLAVSLPTCMMTTMAIVAEKKGISLTGMHMELSKEMSAAPRRVARLKGSIYLPSSLSPSDRSIMEEAAHRCPVKASLDPLVVVEVNFVYSD